MRRLLASLMLAVLIAGAAAAPAAAVLGAPPPQGDEDAAATRTVRPATDPAPSTPPAVDLINGPAGLDPSAPAAQQDTEIAGTPGGRGDWMSSNGLSSPRCNGSRDVSCLDSGTRSIPAPPGHYSIDAWMESGPMGLPTWPNTLSSILGSVWSTIVTITVALISALEWALNIDMALAAGGGLDQLAVLESSWGMPLGVLMLAIGAIWFGLQVHSAQRLSAAFSSAGMGFLLMGLSVAVLSNPSGTLGELAGLSGQLGREAASAPLVIADSERSLDNGLERTWEVVVGRPFGLLEFGDVDWATNPKKLDPALLKEARRIAREEGDHVVRRVAGAKTNADLFLIWPSNGDVRNSRSSDKCQGGACLLHVLCGGDDLSNCKGKGAARVEQRTAKGVDNRAGQIFVVGLGMLSIWFVLAAIVFGLVWTSISVVVTLLELAFVWPLALTFKPEWTAKVSGLLLRLVGAALAKIVFGIAAGITMTMLVLIQKWQVGWFIQWLLTVAGMVLLWQRRSAIKDYMHTLTGGEKTASGARGLAGRLASNWATGVGIGTARRRPGAGKGSAAFAGAGTHGGGGVPTDLPSRPGAGRKALLGAAALGGAVGGPVGSGAAVALLKREAIAQTGRAAGGRVKSAAASAGGSVRDGMQRTLGDAAVQGVQPGDQAAALLATGAREQQLAQAERAAGERAAAQEALDDVRRQKLRAQLLADVTKEGNPGYAYTRDQLQQTAAAFEQASERLQAIEQAAAPVIVAEPTTAELADTGAWLDGQAAAPAESRDYRRLAGIHGVTGSQFDGLPEGQQAQLRRAVDASLAQRRTPAKPVRPTSTSPGQPPVDAGQQGALAALGRVAGGQRWRQP